MLKITSLIIILYFLSFPKSTMAAVLRYTDDKGVLHYVDNPSLVPSKYRDQLKNAKPLPKISISPTVTPPPKSKSEVKIYNYSKPAPKRKSDDNIEVFMTTWCPTCKKLIAFLDSKGIAYTKYDIEADRQANDVFRSLGGNAVPLTKIGEKTILGFQPAAMMALLEKGN